MKIKHGFGMVCLSGELSSELQYKLIEVDHDDDQPPYTALHDKLFVRKEWDLDADQKSLLVDTLREIEDTAEFHSDKRMLKELRRIFVQWGIYRPISEDELARTWVSGGDGQPKKKYDFVFGGQKYVFESWSV